jgi:uroporphyrin-III C-methyltransferase/precorrin-2 dehydrogenase/sirohydrochlorin ferrochelatase
MAAAGDVAWRAGEIGEADVAGVWLVHALTGDAGTDAEVARWAEARRVWCVAGTAGEAGTARTPAVTRHGDVLVGVVTLAGPPGRTVSAEGATPAVADPGRAAAVRDDLAAHLWAGRGDLRRRTPSAAPGGAGTVTLVGGGPGDVELLTVRGRRALAEADVVVADRLGPRAVLAELRPGVEVIEVGKAPGHHPVPQEEIHRILVERAQRGQAVVRLKGGDPYLLGRGGEEVLACREAGVRVVVVPGVTSALAVPAAAGIPVTHRGTSTALHVVTGHDGLDEPSLLALRQRSGTVVVLMGVTTLPRIVGQALDAGADPAIPVAIIENGTLPTQRVTHAPLGRVVAVAHAAAVRAPAVVVLGDVADPALLDPPGPRGGPDGQEEA